MTQTVTIPRMGRIDEACRLLQALALSDAYSLELASLRETLLGPSKWNFTDINRGTFTLDANDTGLAGATTAGADLSWIPDAFLKGYVLDGVRILSPFPCIQIVPRGPRMLKEESNLLIPIYPVDCVVFAQSDQPWIAPQKAIIMCRAFEKLVRRQTEPLGGLAAQLVTSIPTIQQPGGQVARQGTIGVARVRFSVYFISE